MSLLKKKDSLQAWEGNNLPSSVNKKSLVQEDDKAGNQCYTQDNTDTRKTQVCE